MLCTDRRGLKFGARHFGEPSLTGGFVRTDAKFIERSRLRSRKRISDMRVPGTKSSHEFSGHHKTEFFNSIGHKRPLGHRSKGPQMRRIVRWYWHIVGMLHPYSPPNILANYEAVLETHSKLVRPSLCRKGSKLRTVLGP